MTTDSSDDETTDILRRMAAAGDERTELARQTLAAVERILSERGQRVTKRASLVYRCPRGCALAAVYVTEFGVIIRTQGYKLSATVNEVSSTESGRVKNTTDGDRHWRPQVYFLDQAANVGVACDHLRQRVLTVERIESDLARRVRNVTVR